MMNETQVYLKTKRYLAQRGWVVVGGQPPNGTDAFPVIEVSDPHERAKGSRGSFKPDLVALRLVMPQIVLVECKPNFSPEDVVKLTLALSPGRLEMLSIELSQRGVFRRYKWPDNTVLVGQKNVIGCVSFVGIKQGLCEVRQMVFSPDGLLIESDLG